MTMIPLTAVLDSLLCFQIIPVSVLDNFVKLNEIGNLSTIDEKTIVQKFTRAA